MKMAEGSRIRRIWGERLKIHWNNLPLTGTKIYDAVTNVAGLTHAITIGTGDGSTTSFTYTAANIPIMPTSVTVTYQIGGSKYMATDDGKGNISGTDCSGTVNYDTGDISLTFSTAPDSDYPILLNYVYYTNGSGVNVSQAKDGYLHITVSGITSSTVYIVPVVDGVEVLSEEIVYTSDTDEIVPVEFFGGRLAIEAYRLGSDYITLTVEEVRRE